ncbi:MAG: hypothetical protein AAF655_12195 [Bacteroidota bacterium]
MLFWYLFLSLAIILPAIFWSWDAWIKYQNKLVGRRYCEENGLTFLRAKSYQKHTRVYARKDGKEVWANYETDRNNIISWLGKSLMEKLEEK